MVSPPSPYTAVAGWDEVGKAPLEGAAIVGTVARSAGYEVIGYDLRQKPEDETMVFEELRSGDVVCIAGSPDSYRFVKAFSAAIKARDKTIAVILGGPLATVSWKVVLARTSVDYCVVGEGERAFPELLRRLARRDHVAPTGVVSRSACQRGLYIASEAVPLAEVPCPDYSLWVNDPEASRPILVCYSTQRGCRFACDFCANPWRGTWRAAESGKIKSDLQKLKSGGTRKVWFNDPTFNIEEEHCRMVAQLMGSAEVRLPWACAVRATPASSELFSVMKAGGCQVVFLGIESADDTVLAENRKGITTDDVKRCLEAARRAGMPVVGFLVLGLPGETEASIQKTLRFIEDKMHSFVIPRPRFAVPYPGTELFQQRCQQRDRKAFPHREDFEEHILEAISERRCDETDVPTVPAVSPDVIREARNRMLALVEERKGLLLGDISFSRQVD
jgi:radical SAM superfamily enzyme YgiQ (UPF0313 family)